MCVGYGQKSQAKYRLCSHYSILYIEFNIFVVVRSLTVPPGTLKDVTQMVAHLNMIVPYQSGIIDDGDSLIQKNKKSK